METSINPPAAATAASIPIPPAQSLNRPPSQISATSSTTKEDDEDTKDEDIHEATGDETLQRTATLGPVLSRMVTAHSVVVPRLKRRGLLASLTIIPEIKNPYEYARVTKKCITLVVALAGAAAPMASAILFPALGDISKELGSTQTTTNLSVALYMLGMAIFPLWWSSFAERIGYRTIYIISFSLYVVSNVCCAVSVNIGMFIAFRVMSGACAASAQTIGAGTISAIWEVKERGKAMGYFYLGPLMGPLLAPIIGGALTQGLGWRSTLWFLAIFGAALVVGIVFLLPETFRKPKDNRAIPVVEEEKVDLEAAEGAGIQRTLSRVSARTKAKAKTWIVTAKILLVDPLRSLVFVKFPPVLITVYWAGLAFGALVLPPLSSIRHSTDCGIVHHQHLHPKNLCRGALQLLNHHHRAAIHPQQHRVPNRVDRRGFLERRHHATSSPEASCSVRQPGFRRPAGVFARRPHGP
jgi:multidrug resistance protein